MHRGTTVGSSSKRMAIWKARRKASEEASPADTFILDLQPPEMGENNVLLFMPTSMWFVMGALENEYR